MIQPRLILCSGADPPQAARVLSGRKRVELDALGSNGNTHLRLQNVTDAFAKQLTDRLVDLLELATYVYAADCEASRECPWMDDKSTEPWSRDFHFVMPVRDLPFWKRPDVAEALKGALDYLSSDEFGFTFERLRKDRPVDNYLEIENVEDTPFHEAERVIMFSGGLDSLAGAIETAARGDPLVLVSHRPAVQIDTRQRALVRELRRLFPLPLRHIPVWVNKSGFDRESTQRTRSFLFAALGATVAAVLKAGGVRFYENGVISLNWPLAQEALQSRASRTTHPESLRRLQALLRLVTENDKFVVDNPFIFRTKTEVVSGIAQHKAASLIQHTCSCVHTMFQPRDRRHCGRCGQCIDRRLAVLAAGVADHDPEDDYNSNVFTGPRLRTYDRNVAVNHARFARDLHTMAESGVHTTYNLEVTRAARCFHRQGEAAQAFVEMQKRHAQSVCQVLEAQVEQHSQCFVDGSLEPTSLLAVVGRQEHAPAPPVQDPAAPQPAPALTCHQGTFWRLAYGGKEATLPDSKGVRHIAFLLQHPGEEFTPAQLARLSEASGAPDQDQSRLDLGGQYTGATGSDTSSAVRQAVHHALEVIMPDHPAFYQYLTASLHLGERCSFCPASSDAPSHQAPPETAPVARCVGFTHSDDYRSVTNNGHSYALTERQAEVVRILHAAYSTGKPTLSTAAILAKMDGRVERFKPADVFRNKPQAYHELIDQPAKGLFRLRLP